MGPYAKWALADVTLGMRPQLQDIARQMRQTKREARRDLRSNRNVYGALAGEIAGMRQGFNQAPNAIDQLRDAFGTMPGVDYSLLPESERASAMQNASALRQLALGQVGLSNQLQRDFYDRAATGSSQLRASNNNTIR